MLDRIAGYNPTINQYNSGQQPPRNDPFDSRIGNGDLPGGFQGTANRAYTRNVQGNELMGQRMGALLAANNPYMRNAVNRGREQAASRGLLNSSMAAGSAQRAAIEAASPIAAQESQAYVQAASDNQRWLNERQSEQDRLAAANASSAGASAAGAAAAAMQLQMQRERLAFEGEQQGLNRTQALFMADRQMENELTLGEAGYGWDLGRAAFGFENEDYRAGRDFGFQTERDFRQFGFETERDFREFGFEDYAANRDEGFQVARDWRNFGFEERLSDQDYRQNRILQRDRAEQGIQDYAARTGIDLRAQGAQYLQALAMAAMEDPELFNPETVGSMASTFLPIFDDFGNSFFAGLPDLFSNFNRGSTGGSRRRTNTRRGR